MPNGNAILRQAQDRPIESRRFGVEIEVEGIPSASLRAGSTDRARRELRLPTGWRVTSDGSLHDGSELVSPPLTLGDFGQVEQVLNLLKRHGARMSTLLWGLILPISIVASKPPKPGIAMSIRTTSGASCWTFLNGLLRCC